MNLILIGKDRLEIKKRGLTPWSEIKYYTRLRRRTEKWLKG